MKIWVHGPSAWDTVVEVPKYPQPGDFVRAVSKSERVGGSGLNVATALASTEKEIAFITYLGQDNYGIEIKSFLKSQNFSELIIRDLNSPTLHALIIKDQSAERTIIALEQTAMGKLDLTEAEPASGDLFIFTIWRPEYKLLLSKLRRLGAIVIVGAAALEDSEVFADYLIGSKADFMETSFHGVYQRFRKLVLTDGANGATLYSASGECHQPSLAKEVLDTVGAGDSFLAGFAYALACGLSDQDSLFLASAWAACALQSDTSLPPSWKQVREKWGLK